MSRPHRAVWHGLALMLPWGTAACGPEELIRGQVVLALTTDAPLPHDGDDDVMRPAPLFDRLRLDVFLGDEPTPCSSCTRIVPLSEAEVEGEGISLGIVTEAGGAVVHAQLYRRSGQLGDEPTAAGSVEAWIEVPSVPEGDVVHRWFLLPTERVAQPMGSREAPVAAEEGQPPSGVVGSWPGAERIPCTLPVGEGEVCVPGGAFWMGSERAQGFLTADVTPERLVIVSPFIMHTTEVSVGMLRAAAALDFTGALSFSGTPDGNQETDWCSAAADGSRDGLPMNCVTSASAAESCRRLGGETSTLPSEAQFEYVAGGLASRLYVWGESDPECGDAVFGVSESYNALFNLAQPTVCPTKGIGGPEAVNRPDRGRDTLVIDRAEIYDLAGNLAEITRDGFMPYGSSCWSTGLVTDPVCQEGTTATVKGGSWLVQPEALRAASRGRLPIGEVSPGYGFRCVRPGR